MEQKGVLCNINKSQQRAFVLQEDLQSRGQFDTTAGRRFADIIVLPISGVSQKPRSTRDSTTEIKMSSWPESIKTKRGDIKYLNELKTHNRKIQMLFVFSM